MPGVAVRIWKRGPSGSSPPHRAQRKGSPHGAQKDDDTTTAGGPMRTAIIATLCFVAACATTAMAQTAPAAISTSAYLLDASSDGSGAQTNQGMRARLTAADGAPLAGRLLTFAVGGRDVCTEETDADGRATCRGPNAVIDLAAVVGAGGYDVTFAGDATAAAARAHGPIARLDGTDLL